MLSSGNFSVRQTYSHLIEGQKNEEREKGKTENRFIDRYPKFEKIYTELKGRSVDLLIYTPSLPQLPMSCLYSTAPSVFSPACL